MLRRREAEPELAPAPEAGSSPIDHRAEEAFGEKLAAKGLITRVQLGEAMLQLQESGKRIGPLLVELGALDGRDLARELAAETGLPYTDLRGVEPEASALQRVPEALALGAGVLPLRLIDGCIELAVSDPYDMNAIHAVAQAANAGVFVRVAPAMAILRAIHTSYRSLVDVGGLVQPSRPSPCCASRRSPRRPRPSRTTPRSSSW